jgi:hypothetical protein
LENEYILQYPIASGEWIIVKPLRGKNWQMNTFYNTVSPTANGLLLNRSAVRLANEYILQYPIAYGEWIIVKPLRGKIGN